MKPLDADKVATILRLHFVDGRSVRWIARSEGMSRKTVRKILGRKPQDHRLEKQPRVSILDPYIPFIKKQLAEIPDIKAPKMLEQLRPQGYTGGITILRDRMRVLRPHEPQTAYLTLNHQPGASLQIDWGDFGFVLPGCPRRVSCFAAILPFSRKMFIEFFLSQRMGPFLRAMERTHHELEGVTETDVFDNMKTVVLERTRHVTRFHPRFVEYARVRGFSITACNPKSPHEKGGVERAIGFVRTRFWPGRRCRDLMDLNRQAAEWLDDYGNHRTHEVTGKIPSLVFEHEEKASLRPLSETRIETDDIESCTVTKMFRVRFDRNTYSVPWRLVGQSVVIRADDEWLRVFLGHKEVARHRRCWDVGQDIKEGSHEAGLLQRKPKAAAGTLPHALRALGNTGKEYFKILAAQTRSVHKEVIRLIYLAELFGFPNLEVAMHEVMTTGHVGADYIEYVLRHRKKIKPDAAPLKLGSPELDNISLPEPDMGIYDDFSISERTRDPGPVPHLEDEDDYNE